MATASSSSILPLAYGFVVLIYIASADYDLTILHTGDVLCHFEEANLNYEACTTEDKERNHCFGGWARLHTVVNGYRQIKDNLLVLDVGNQFQGTLWFNVYEHHATSYFMNRTKYDAMTLSSHEFDLKPSGLAPFLDDASFPVLSCNIDDSNEQVIQDKYQKYHIVTMNGQQIGLVGFSPWDTEKKSNTGELVFLDEVENIRNVVEELEKIGINKIIAMGRSYFDVHMRIAEEVPGVDIVIGGDRNYFLYKGTPPSVEEPTHSYPIVVQPNHDTSTSVLLVQAYWAGKYVGHLDVTFDDNGNVIDWDGNPFILDGDVEQDPDTLSEITEWAKKVHEYQNEYFCETNVLLAGLGPDGDGKQSPCRYGECGVGNMVADAFVQQNLKHPTENQWNDAAIAFINAGAMRNTLQVGEIKRADILKLLQSTNTVDSFDLQGQYLLDVLEHSATGHNVSDPSTMTKFLQFSGLKVVYDLSRPDGERVQNVSVLCTECQIPAYEPLDLLKTYRIIAQSFLANGGDGYSMIAEHKTNHIEGVVDTVVLEAYIKQMSPLHHHGDEGRISFTDDEPPPCGEATKHDPSSILVSLAIILPIVNWIWF